MIKSRDSSMSSGTILVTILLMLCYALVNGSGYDSGVESTIQYDLQEEGEVQGRSFRRYVAVDYASEIPLTTNQWIKALQKGNVTLLNQILTNIPYKTYYFETKSVTNISSASTKHPFEFVLVDAPSLAKRKPRFRSFEKPCQLLAAGDDGNGNSSYKIVRQNQALPPELD